MKWFLILLGVVAVVATVITLVGVMLPRDHIASTTTLIKAPN
jgi:hypothetical protein